MKIAVGARLQRFTQPESMGVVTDALFINCYWPKLDRPTRIFADGSSGIKVMGTTPRNVWFPDDIEFLDYYPDALYPAELAVKTTFPPNRIGLVNLSPAESQVWWDAYNEAVKGLHSGATVITTRRDCNFLRHRKEVSCRTVTLAKDSVDGDTILRKGAQITKTEYEEYVAELTPHECVCLVDDTLDETDLRASKTFLHVSTQLPLI
ncbi:MAG: hypothetical protein Q8L37_00120 [Candidatus Gottesmanbacteria bacterium]|nr:hypothetical protein [Candidatus Gottesmanbacteria bacterium]